MQLHRTGEHSPTDLAHLFGVGRSTVYRALTRAAPPGGALIDVAQAPSTANS